MRQAKHSGLWSQALTWKKDLSANSLQSKHARVRKDLPFVYLYVQQRSYTWIRDRQTPSSSETVLQNAVGSAGIYSSFPKALFRPNKEFIFKESLCKRIQVTESIENISLLITTTLTMHKDHCNDYCWLYLHTLDFAPAQRRKCGECCLEAVWQRWAALLGKLLLRMLTQ